MILTQDTGAILGPVARLLGYIMNWIFEFTCWVFPEDSVLYGNIGLCIILFTIIIYLCLLPLTIKQQKFSKLSQKMQPEIQAIRDKYKNRKDQESMMAMNEETQLVYQKYGISPSGSCIQLLIQMPILFALYRVIYNVPAYVSGLKEHFMPVAEGIIGTAGYKEKMTEFFSGLDLNRVKLNLNGTTEQAVDSIIDVLYSMPTNAWDTLRDNFSDLSGAINTLEASMENMNYFLGINIANAPLDLIKTGWSAGDYLLVFGAILVPIISAATQFLNIKLMPTATAATTDNQNDAMANSMKTMNYMMPLMSFVMVFSLPVGMGIYWIAGALIRGIQQVLINKYVEKIDLDEIVKKNEAKAKKKREKMGISQNQIYNAAHMNTRNLADRANVSADKEEQLRQATEYTKYAKPGSLAAKANMVKEFNERNNK